ncbi:hypothetical protein P872_13710 [Rhodonellum psychrophilum GCM71 = DSM 17998]|uniref:Uncharacterized protein n=1 Tax=Rhodonellum psychrophilum GCM71 = DSM 17998 TaxID=1123057 RepID=U5BR45_9BACT|nr:hypothetical protein P872_13710 [Rhodonellum psychrophilum GCM71 = DSM 17998]
MQAPISQIPKDSKPELAENLKSADENLRKKEV